MGIYNEGTSIGANLEHHMDRMSDPIMNDLRHHEAQEHTGFTEAPVQLSEFNRVMSTLDVAIDQLQKNTVVFIGSVSEALVDEHEKLTGEAKETESPHLESPAARQLMEKVQRIYYLTERLEEAHSRVRI